jgi:hypothetical protein
MSMLTQIRADEGPVSAQRSRMSALNPFVIRVFVLLSDIRE